MITEKCSVEGCNNWVQINPEKIVRVSFLECLKCMRRYPLNAITASFVELTRCDCGGSLDVEYENKVLVVTATNSKFLCRQHTPKFETDVRFQDTQFDSELTPAGRYVPAGFQPVIPYQEDIVIPEWTKHDEQIKGILKRSFPKVGEGKMDFHFNYDIESFEELDDESAQEFFYLVEVDNDGNFISFDMDEVKEPSLTAQRQRYQAGVWAAVIYMFYRMRWTEGEIAEELGIQPGDINDVLLRINRVAKGQRANGTGKLGIRPNGRPKNLCGDRDSIWRL